ncbi:NUDIX domain-containing protein [Bacillus ndiopicus]|uniref:NUDIX domain-containing protein n=1 Tax=Bacillus ndiopicus TaxID=1347368 RepID=UPI0005A90E57|nr:NUDIX hydrolase [Bacillus ndiopicus]
MQTKKHGYTFLELIRLEESEITALERLAGSYAIIQCEGKILLCYNRWREQWELPAGMREADETPKQCAIRELYEETGQHIKELLFVGVAKSENEENGEIKYNPIYYGDLKQLMPFTANEEIVRIFLWDMVEVIDIIDEVDFAILQSIFHII